MDTKFNIQKKCRNHTVVASDKELQTEIPVVEFSSGKTLTFQYYTDDVILNEQNSFDLDDSFTDIITGEKETITIDDFIKNLEEQIYSKIGECNFCISSDVIASLILMVERLNQPDTSEESVQESTDRFFDQKDVQPMYGSEITIDSDIVNGVYDSHEDNYDDESDPY